MKDNSRLIREANTAHLRQQTRRHFLREASFGFGGLALASLMGSCGKTGGNTAMRNVYDPANPLAPRMPMFPGKAKSVIYLHMAGAPSQLELFDYKPELMKMDGQDCPPSLLEGKRFAFIRGVPKMMGPRAAFKQWGDSGAWISDSLPHLCTIADELTFLKCMTTDQFNH